MPLSEFLEEGVKSKAASNQQRMSNLSSTPFSLPDHEFAELLWENGQIVTHDHSSRAGKNSTHTERTQGNSGQKNVHSIANDLFGNALSEAQDNDIVPWVHYPVDESLRNDFCMDFLEEFATDSLGFGMGDEMRNIGNAQNEHASRTLAVTVEPSRSRSEQLLHSMQPCQSLVTNSTSRVLDVGTGHCCKSQIGTSVEVANTISPNQSSTRPARANTGMEVVNFSMFSRPVISMRENLQNVERLRSDVKASTLATPSSTVKNTTSVKGQSASSVSKSESKSHEKHLQPVAVPVDQPRGLNGLDAAIKDYQNSVAVDCDVAVNVALSKHEAAKGPEAVVASSSVCSVDAAGAESSDPKSREKRKSSEIEESSSNHSEDPEDESIGVRRPGNVRRKGSKRSRASEVHNLSEKRRRERINEKMRALQELIPSCNKADKASMLEDAIEYLKSLQQQVQIMSMGSGLYMPSMMLPPGMQHMRASPMTQFSPMGVGVGMGIGMGYGMGMYDFHGPPGCPIMPVSAMHRSPFPCPPIPGHLSLHGHVGAMNPQIYGAPGLASHPTAPGLPHLGSSPEVLVRANSAPQSKASITVPVPSSDVINSTMTEQKQGNENLNGA